MEESELIEYLGENYPHWRDLYGCPYDAAQELGIALDDDGEYSELCFE